ncbi:hypothetical protein D3C73_1278910 [compost metagenome]
MDTTQHLVDGCRYSTAIFYTVWVIQLKSIRVSMPTILVQMIQNTIYVITYANRCREKTIGTIIISPASHLADGITRNVNPILVTSEVKLHSRKDMLYTQ